MRFLLQDKDQISWMCINRLITLPLKRNPRPVCCPLSLLSNPKSKAQMCVCLSDDEMKVLGTLNRETTIVNTHPYHIHCLCTSEIQLPH